MGSGLNARAVDYARFGRLYLRRGDWNGRRIVPEQWVTRSTTEDPIARGAADYYTTNFARTWPEWQDFLASGTGFYGWHWWGYRREGGPDDFFAEGLLGQHIYVSPAKNLILVRNGMDEGKTDFYPAILKQIADRL
jgi:CubicO group peptidase (beta-lactamase class C family)